MRRKSPVSDGISQITAAVVVVSIIISLVTGQVGHWAPVALGVIVGLMAVKSIRR